MDEAVVTALLSYLPRQAAAGNQPTLGIDEARLVIMALHTLQALATSPPIASQIVGTAGGSGRIFSSLLSRHDHVAFEAARLLLRLFSPGAGRPVSPTWVGAAPGSPTAGSSHEAISSARGAKSVCFISNARCTSLVAPLRQRRGASPLVAGAIIETVVAVSCNPGARTTELSTREALLQEVAGLGRPMFALFAHPARQVGDATALVMRTIADGGAGAAAPMREAALAEGAVLHHLLKALGPSGERAKLSRDLVAVWADAHEPTLSLLRRVFPSGLMRYLDEPKKKPPPPKLLDLSGRADRGIRNPLERSATERLAEVHHAAERPLSAPTVQIGGRDEPLSAAPSSSSILERLAHGVGSGVVDRLPSNLDASLNGASSGGALNDGERDERDGPSTSSLGQLPRIPERFLAGKARSVTSAQLRGNWEAFWAQVDRDHSHAALVWNERTRAELREALQVRRATDFIAYNPLCFVSSHLFMYLPRSGVPSEFFSCSFLCLTLCCQPSFGACRRRRVS